jgi:hypothetical protein
MQGKLIGAGLACAVLLAGCGDINVKKYLPFSGDAVQERSRTPTNATEYQCTPASESMCGHWKAARRFG